MLTILRPRVARRDVEPGHLVDVIRWWQVLPADATRTSFVPVTAVDRRRRFVTIDAGRAVTVLPTDVRPSKARLGLPRGASRAEMDLPDVVALWDDHGPVGAARRAGHRWTVEVDGRPVLPRHARTLAEALDRLGLDVPG